MTRLSMFLRDSIYFIYATNNNLWCNTVYTKTQSNAHAQTRMNTLRNQIKINMFLYHNYNDNFIYGNNISINCLSCMLYFTKYW